VIQPETLLQLPGGAYAPQFSPDGAHLAYVEDGQVLVGGVEGAVEPRPMGTGRILRWHPSGDSLTVLRAAEGPPRVWRLPINPTPDAGATPLSPEDTAVRDYALSPDGRTLAVIEAAAPIIEWDRTSMRFRYPPPGALWFVDAASGVAQRRLELPPDETPLRPCLSWSPDGRHLAWEVFRYPDDRQENLTEMRLVAAAGGPLRRIVPTGACQTKFPAAVGSLSGSSAGLWRPDSGALAFTASPHPYGVYALFSLVTWDLAGGIVRYLTRDPVLVFGAAWAPDGQTIYAAARNGGITEQLYAVSVADGALRRLVPARAVADADGATGALRLPHPLAHLQAPVVSRDGRWLACEAHAPDRLPEVWLVATDGTAVRPVTNAHRRLTGIEGLHALESELVRWRSADGLELEGMLVYPLGYGPKRRPPAPMPTIVDVHGGPLPVAPPRGLGDGALSFTGLHWLAEHGYLCFAVDYRQSGSYGWQHLQRMIDAGDAGIGLDATDILCGVDHLVAAGLADPARLGLRGFSHGGYLVNWLVTQSGRFRAAVSFEGVADFAAFPFPNTSVEVRFGGGPEVVPERYRRAAPLTYAAQARTPTLLFEGEHSGARLGQGEAFYRALRVAGVEAEYVCVPSAGHGGGQRSHQVEYLQRMLAWFDRYLRA
jgi:dipeptidyl aminopeptidase/acylaminoacyl peptidase